MTRTQANAPIKPATDRGGVDEELIGSEETHIPHWAQIDETVVTTRLTRIARAIPVMVAVIALRAWRVNRMLTALALLAQLGAGFSTAFGLLATANVFTHLLQQGPTPDRLLAALPSLGWVIAAQAAGALLTATVGALQSALAPQVERAAADELYAAILAVDLVAFDDAEFTELIRNTTSMGINQIRGATSNTGDLLAGLVSMAAAVTTVGILHPLLAPVVLLTALPQGWANIRAAKANYEHFLKMSSRNRRLAIIGGIITDRDDAAEVRAFTTQPMLLAEHRRIARSLEREALALNIHTTRIRILGRSISGVATGFAYTVLGLLIFTSSLPLALAGAAALAMRTASSAVSTSVFTANRLYETSLYYEMYLACLRDTRARARTTPASTSTRTRPADQPPPMAAPVPPPIDGPTVIETKAVSFTYPGQTVPALTDITITLRAGQVIALVGENGSGKSTLAKLLTGLYLPDTGTISWDGVDIATLDPAWLQSRIAVVMQYPTRWPMTAANNIRIGRIHTPDPDGCRLADAAARAGADTVLAELPNGPNTMLSRRFHSGRDLSGGQWQRISVARALYRDASLIIADEPTAALDAKAEHAVFDTLRQLPISSPANNTRPQQRITVLITHRLANVRNADHIIVLDRGHLTAQGTHDQLMAQPGNYRDLFTLQARSYRDEQLCTQCATR